MEYKKEKETFEQILTITNEQILLKDKIDDNQITSILAGLQLEVEESTKEKDETSTGEKTDNDYSDLYTEIEE
jgi:hypothetical protein